MPTPRTPTAIKKLKGTFQPSRNNPAEPIPKQPLGDPPDYFTKPEATCWAEIQTIVPSGVLFASDRWNAEIACLLMAKLRRREPMTGAELARLADCLTKMGMTPADRTRITVSDAGGAEDEDFSIFVQ